MERSDSGILIGATVLVVIGACGAGLYLFMRQPPPQELSASGFDVSHVDAPPPPAPVADVLVEPRAAAPMSSPAPMVGSLKALSIAGAPTGAATQEAAAPSDVQAFAEKRKREQEFMQKHGAALRNYMSFMGSVTSRYYQKHPVVRDVDKSFAAMPRYMEVKRRYSGDPFMFAREATALPEVRAEISKRMKDPAVWRAALGMMLDTLKNPPPKEIYGEARRFMTQDAAMLEYLPKAGMEITQNVGAMVQGMPPNADLTPLRQVAQDVAPPGTMPASAGASAAGRR